MKYLSASAGQVSNSNQTRAQERAEAEVGLRLGVGIIGADLDKTKGKDR